MDSDIKRTVEALLFAAPEPLPMSRLQGILPAAERRTLQAALVELAADYEAAGHAFQLAELGGGWRIVTRPEYAARIEDLLRGQRRVRLSRASLETLAVVAYRQPCTRVDVEAVRGVNCGGSLATLVERGLLRIHGRAETLGRPLLYGTTSEFLAFLGVNGLHELPRLAEIEALLRPRGEDGEGDEESPVPPAERRERLLAGMDALGTLIAERELERGEGVGLEAAGSEADWDLALGEERAALPAEGADPEAEDHAEAHRAALAAALDAERALLAAAEAEELDFAPGTDAATAEDAAAGRTPALARIARALAGNAAYVEEPAAARSDEAEADAERDAETWAAAAGGED